MLRHPNVDAVAIQGQLLELQGLILSAQAALGEAEDDNRKLRSEVEDLHDRLRVAASVTHGNNAYWTRHPNGKLDGPFCTVCFDDSKKLVRMHHTQGRNRSDGLLRVYMCHLHEGVVIRLKAALFNESQTIS